MAWNIQNSVRIRPAVRTVREAFSEEFKIAIRPNSLFAFHCVEPSAAGPDNSIFEMKGEPDTENKSCAEYWIALELELSPHPNTCTHPSE